MTFGVLTTVIGATGATLAVATAGHHLYHIVRQQDDLLHGSIARYYRVLIPYTAVSGVVAAAFFLEAFMPRSRLAQLLGGTVLVDLAMLGFVLVWIGSAGRVFGTIDDMADAYFVEGEGHAG